MTTAERTILVALLAGAVAIMLYVRDRRRAGKLDWRRDVWQVLIIVGALTFLVAALLLGSSGVLAVAIPVGLAAAATYVLVSAKSDTGRLGGWVLVAAAGAALAAQLLRFVQSAT